MHMQRRATGLGEQSVTKGDEPTEADYEKAITGILNWNSETQQEQLATIELCTQLAVFAVVAAAGGPAGWAALAVATFFEIGVYLSGVFGVHPNTWCTGYSFDQLKKDGHNSPLWVHYPGYAGHGAVNGTCADLNEYPAIKALQGEGPYFPATCDCPPIPNAPAGSFEQIWYPIYAKLWETQFNCGPSMPQPVMDGILDQIVGMWNAAHTPGIPITYKANLDGPHGRFGYNPLDEAFDNATLSSNQLFKTPLDALIVRHSKDITIHRGGPVLHLNPRLLGTIGHTLNGGPGNAGPGVDHGASTSTKVAGTVVGAAAASVLTAAIVGWVTHKSTGYVLDKAWDKVKGSFAGKKRR